MSTRSEENRGRVKVPLGTAMLDRVREGSKRGAGSFAVKRSEGGESGFGRDWVQLRDKKDGKAS